MEVSQIKRQRRTAAEIKTILEEFKQSDLRAKEFCKLYDIDEGTFYKWKQRYAKQEAIPTSSFIALRQPFSKGSEVKLFAEVKGIKLYQVVAASYLKELLA